MQLAQRQRIEHQVDRAAGQALAHVPHEEQIGRPGQKEPVAARMLVYGALDGRQQLGRLLHLIQHQLVRAGPQAGRVLAHLAQRVEVVHGVIAPAGERLGPPQGGALADLPGAGQHDNRMRLARRLQQRRQPATIIVRRF
jgi:hypothetical protein